jgi:hypothetical protein
LSHWITVWRSWAGRVGSRIISLTSIVVAGGGALLGYRGARIGCPRPTSAVGTIVGGSCTMLLGTSPMVPTPALAGSANVVVASHDTSSPGSPSLSTPPLGKVGPFAGGSSTKGWLALQPLAPHAGTARSAPTCVCSPQGAAGLPPSATTGHRSSIDSHFNKQAVHQEPSITLKKYSKLKMELTIETPAVLFGTSVLARNLPAQYLHHPVSPPLPPELPEPSQELQWPPSLLLLGLSMHPWGL